MTALVHAARRRSEQAPENRPDAACLCHCLSFPARPGRMSSGNQRPIAIDLFCGLGGWTEALLAEGFDVIGFDVEQHTYDEDRYPGQLVIQDVLTLRGRQFQNASLIVASPPCTEYSYMAMPWSRAKQIARALRGDGQFPEGYKGSRCLGDLTRLFSACFRIQREASEAAGHLVPLVVENVKGAQPWVGRAAWNFGSFYLWGDVPALMPMTLRAAKVPGFRFDGSGGSFQTAAVNGTKNDGGSWFNVAHNTTSGVGQNPVHEGQKVGDRNAWRASAGALKSARFTNPDEAHTRADAAAVIVEGKKGVGIGSASWQAKESRHPNDPRNTWSGSTARKAASARIAKIPFALAQHIARCYRPLAINIGNCI